ncbi:hypothetical protein HORIV_62610 [Vreelandella olivaria]|uniref:1,4-dihydroxy-2-naphthoyl-CoA synthase n=1 Tax=Vreelandella olivaria TaxID=390919 RepID=A0ABM7GSN4_9GAMM|nr:hypothetical protein HORIV_62610 [Halomonas olivaria]
MAGSLKRLPGYSVSHIKEGIARITINRPEVRNAFRPLTVSEMIQALSRARYDSAIGAIILTGAGDKAFCSGGDQRIRGDYGGYQDEEGAHHLNVLDFQRDIRTCPKPIIAMVAGYAIGGGHVLHMMCDLTIAADNAILARLAPKLALLMAATAPRIWRALWARKRPGKSGSSAASMMPPKRLKWGWSIMWCPWQSWKRERTLVPRDAAE